MAIVLPVFRASARGAALLLMCAVSVAASAAGGQKPPATPADKGKPGLLSFVEAPSHESHAAREKRLKRECKGRPNAGMCLGHTR